MLGLTVDEVQEFISRLAMVSESAPQQQTLSDPTDAPDRAPAHAPTGDPAHAPTGDPAGDRARIALLSALESLKAAAAAAQARVAVEFDRSQRQVQRDAGVPAAKVGVGIAEQIALARRESPTRGSRLLGLAKALVHELPHTLAAVSAGEVSEWRAMIVAQATAVLSVADRQAVDARLAGRLASMSDRQVRAAALAAAYDLDPRSVVDRAAYAVTQRRVTLRPAPDTMAYLTALLPAAQAVAVFAALHSAAGTARAEGDARSADQVKADTLVERVTGQATAAAVPVEIGLVMTDRTLFAGDHTPAVLSGYGPIPATHARTLAAGAASQLVAPGDDPVVLDAARVWIRRLYLAPETRVISDADRRRRLFPTHLRQVVIARDQWCRTPWCGAPIRHIDHARPYALGGVTDPANAQGLCERCNHVKEASGWSSSSGDPQESADSRDPAAPWVVTTTPTGKSYRTAPAGWPPSFASPSGDSGMPPAHVALSG